MIEGTWKAIGKDDMIPSLGGIGLFRGKLVNLCGNLTQISMNVQGTSTEEYFEIVKFVEDNALFTMLLGKPWIEKDQARKQEAEKDLKQQRQELRDFMTRRIAQLIEERKNRSRVLDPKNLDDEADRMLEAPWRTEKYVGQVIPVDLKKEFQHCEVTMPREEKNQNGKKMTEMKLTGKKARKLMKKKEKLEKLQNIPEETPQKENMQNLSFVGIAEQ
jgi:hypothetical protein